jgi:hypothetical protein
MIMVGWVSICIGVTATIQFLHFFLFFKVDFLLYNLMFCDENGFTVPKKSAFFSVMKQVFEHAFEEPASSSVQSQSVTRDESLNFFKAKILAHSVEAPQNGRSGVFNLQEVSRFTLNATIKV